MEKNTDMVDQQTLKPSRFQAASIDIGASFFKGMVSLPLHDDQALSEAIDTDKMTRFPSIAIEVNKDKDTLTIKGQHFYVGEIALQLSDEQSREPENNPDYHGSKSQTAMICYFFETLKVEGHLPLLVRSLPYDQAANKTLVEKLEKETTFEWSRGDTDQTVQVGRVVVMPQGVGAFRACQHGFVESTEITQAIDERGDIMAAELGACTIDRPVFRFVEKHDDYRLVPDASKSNRHLNGQFFIDRIRKAIEVSSGADGDTIFYHDVCKTLMNNPISRFRVSTPNGVQKVDLTDAFNRAKIEFTKQFLTFLAQDQRSYTQAAVIAVVGGGAHFIDERQIKDSRIVVLIDDRLDSVGQLLDVLHTIRQAKSKSVKTAT